MAGPAHRDFLDPAVLARLSRLTLGARFPMVGSVTGLHRSATRGASVEFAEYRKYAPGDDIRHVDWRVYARTDRFFMKEFEADTNLRCQIVVDTSASMGFASGRGTKFEFARRLAAALAYLLGRQGDAVGLTCFAEKAVVDIPARRSPAHLSHVFDALAAARPAGSTAVVPALHLLAEKLRRRALVIVLSDCFEEADALLGAFRHLHYQKHDLAVFHVLDRQELAFDFDRPIRFADLESPFEIVTDPAVIASAYRKELDGWLAAVQRGSREFGVDYRRVATDADYEQVLAEFLLQRQRPTSAAGGGRR